MGTKIQKKLVKNNGLWRINVIRPKIRARQGGTRKYKMRVTQTFKEESYRQMKKITWPRVIKTHFRLLSGKTCSFLLLIRWNQIICVYLHSNIEQFMANIERIEQREPSSLLEWPSRERRRQSQKNEALNRLRAVLSEQDKTNRWLAEQLGKTEHTISRWRHNKSQPSVAQLNEIANVLKVDVRTLIMNPETRIL